jgi:hypothetical protein
MIVPSFFTKRSTLDVKKFVIAVQILFACALMWGVLDLARNFLGRPAAWVIGLSLLSFATFALFRLRK